MDKTIKFIGAFLCVTLLGLVVSFVLAVNLASERRVDFLLLPEGAQVLQDMGNGWSVVGLNGRKYLYRATVEDRVKTIVMTPY